MEIEIILEGGIVQMVTDKQGNQVPAVVWDYDTDSIDPEALEKDEGGADVLVYSV